MADKTPTKIKNKADTRGRIKTDAKGNERVVKGRTRYASKLNMKRSKEGKEQEQTKVEAEANVEIGEFVSELAVALRYRDRDGLDSGDWIEDPERLFTDGLVFGEEYKSQAQGKLQVTVTLDASQSMWNQYLMKYAAPTFRALDKMMRQAQAELPPGSLSYSPFVFHGQAFPLPPSLVDQYSQGVYKEKGRYKSWDGTVKTYDRENYMAPSAGVRSDLYLKAIQNQEIPGLEGLAHLKETPSWGTPEYEQFWSWSRNRRMLGDDTLLAPLFAAIEDWEKGNNHDATRLDIVITDGQFENEADLRLASEIQERRNGRLTTVLLNFLPVAKWSASKLPDRCLQQPVDKDNIGASVRTVILEAVGSML